MQSLTVKMAATAGVVKEAVKESLMGTEEPAAQLSVQTKLRFTNNAVKDPETGEMYMGPEEFVNAVAPSGEDYVSSLSLYNASLEPLP